MNKPLMIRGGRVIDPIQHIDQITNIFITDGKINWLGEGEACLSNSDCRIIEANGLVVTPGFIDLHCHLREPGYEDQETITSGSKAGSSGGYTTICCMPNTNPPIDNTAMVELIKERSQTEAITRVLPIACITRARKGKTIADMAELAKAGVVGFSDDGLPVSCASLMRKAMEYVNYLGLPIMEHAEELSLSEGGQMNEGLLASRLGLPGIPPVAEEVAIARDIALAELTKTWLHLCHVSTKGSVELIRQAKSKGIPITAETTPHHLILTETSVFGYNTYAKVNPPLRTIEDNKALLEGLIDGTIDAIATDHAPHTEQDKCCEFNLASFGISGLETAFASLMSLVHNGSINLNTLIHKLTAGPALILNNRYGQLGTLKVGSEADITIFDPTEEWLVDVTKFFSKGKNTPLEGKVLRGRIKYTIFQGVIVFCDK
jgi:dihydroorotase